MNEEWVFVDKNIKEAEQAFRYQPIQYGDVEWYQLESPFGLKEDRITEVRGTSNALWCTDGRRLYKSRVTDKSIQKTTWMEILDIIELKTISSSYLGSGIVSFSMDLSSVWLTLADTTYSTMEVGSIIRFEQDRSIGTQMTSNPPPSPPLPILCLNLATLDMVSIDNSYDLVQIANGPTDQWAISRVGTVYWRAKNAIPSPDHSTGIETYYWTKMSNSATPRMSYVSVGLDDAPWFITADFKLYRYDPESVEKFVPEFKDNNPVDVIQVTNGQKGVWAITKSGSIMVAPHKRYTSNKTPFSSLNGSPNRRTTLTKPVITYNPSLEWNKLVYPAPCPTFISSEYTTFPYILTADLRINFASQPLVEPYKTILEKLEEKRQAFK